MYNDVHVVEEDVALVVGFFFLSLTFEVSSHKEEAFSVLGASLVVVKVA